MGITMKMSPSVGPGLGQFYSAFPFTGISPKEEGETTYRSYMYYTNYMDNFFSPDNILPGPKQKTI